MSKKTMPRCDVSGCRKTAVTNFCTPINGLRVVWWACDGCAKTYVKNLKPRTAKKDNL